MVRSANKEDLAQVAALAAQLWQEHTAQELLEAFSAALKAGNSRFFLIEAEGEPAGFAQCQLRQDYVEGTQTSPVGYLEGIFVREGFRHRGFARALLQACEAWAREQGCSEFASDCSTENLPSIRFHRALEFEEAGRIVCFVKRL